MDSRLLALSIVALMVQVQPVSLPPLPRAAVKTEHSVRVSMRCDKDVTGSASVNLYADNVYVGVSPTEIFCGDHLEVATTALANGYAVTVDLETLAGEAFCTMSQPAPLPDRLSCTVNPADPHSPGGRITLHQPK